MYRYRIAGLARTRTLGVLLTIVFLSSALSCSKNGTPDPVSFPGIWTGYFSFGQDKHENAFQITILDDKSTMVDVDYTGTNIAWGAYRLTVTGSPVIQVDEDLLGEVTFTRYRAGIDTLTATGVLSGTFNRQLAQILGTWYIPAGQPFTADGSFGARKEGWPSASWHP